MKYKNIFITGANKGIGYEFIRQFISNDDPPSIIFATYRNASTLQDLKTLQEKSEITKVVLIKMDVNDPEEIEIARQIVEANVGEEGLHLLINNAGISEMLPIDQVTIENIEKHIKTNTIAPLMITTVMRPLLEKSAFQEDGHRAAILNISSTLGSIELTGTTLYSWVDPMVPAYKMSKAALNMAMRVSSIALKEKGILVVMMCPGWVKTDLGNKEKAELTPEESISAMIKTIGELNADHHGTFIDRFGKPIPF
ncbi:C-signal [Parasteatoda tepidariorum]|uniref:C-signal n=1 Tax=Parasteatoda tepidariorum TaxID=114398 RepID=UPI001C728687|nr:C-factor-like [Parasteatoda tepidariorum]